MASEAIVFLDNHLGGNHASAQGGDSAKTVEFAGELHLAAETLDGSVGQKFEHECFAIADAKVVEADTDLAFFFHYEDDVYYCGLLFVQLI